MANLRPNLFDLPDVMDYQKTTSYGPAQYNGKRSTGGPVPTMRDWGGGSYDKSGRACENRAPGYDKSCDYKVQHTTDKLK